MTEENGQQLPDQWRNAIVGEGEEDPEQLLANPENWRIHPRYQREALKGVMQEIGWAQRVIINRTTGHLVDGHLRVDLAMEHGQKVPVLYIEVTEEQEQTLLTALDPIAALAAADKPKLKELIKKTAANTQNEGIRDLLQRTAKSNQLVIESLRDKEKEQDTDKEKFEDLPDELEGAHSLKPEMTFDSDAMYGIPELIPDMIPDVGKIMDEQGIQTWCGIDLLEQGIYQDNGNYWFWPIGASMKGLDKTRAIFAYYAEDYKFEASWQAPDIWVQKMLNGGFPIAIVPNFSVWWSQPKAIDIFQMYRAAWMGRYMQEAGIMVIPDLKTTTDRDYPLEVAGVPKGANAVCLQVQTIDKDDPEQAEKTQNSFRQMVRRVQPKTVLIYGSKYGRELLKEVEPEGTRMVYLPTVMDMRRDHIQAKTEQERRYG